MGRRKKPVFEQVTIETIGAEGKAIARVNDMVVFVDDVIPGDVVDIKIRRKKKSYMEGFPIAFHEYSPDRVTPFCSHFGACGGCKWQFLPYSHQLTYKQQQVTDAFERIGKFDIPEVTPILPSPKETFYRNKLEFTFTHRRWLTQDEINTEGEITQVYGLGLHVPKKFDKVVDIQKCYLQPDPSNDIRNAIRDFAIKKGYSFFDIRNQEGFLRNLIIRTSETGEVMVIVIFFFDDAEARNSLLDYIGDTFPEVTSLMYIINEKKNDSIDDQEVVLHKGRNYIFEQMDGLQFKIGAKSFFQTNTLQAFNLYQLIEDYAGLQGNETVYDLYSGTGSIACFLARKARKVIGIEYISEAIEDARENADINGLDNTAFYAGDMKDILTYDFVHSHGTPDVMVIDPPRAGMHQDVVKVIRDIAPRKIVYVSCNPATQARDIGMLKDMYAVKAYRPVDMFPHTYHVENIALLDYNEDI